MMKKIEFIREPGYTYDLLTLFRIYFNKSFFAKEPLGYQYAPEDRDHFSTVVDAYLPISDELLPFFYMADDNMCFMTQYYYMPYEEKFITGEYNVSFVQNAIAEHDKLIDNMYRFYFPNISDETIVECKMSAKAANALVKKSKYSGELKSELLSFLVDPVPVIQKLSYELMEKSFVLTQEYEKRYKEIVEFQKEIDVDCIINWLEQDNLHKVETEYCERICVSVGLNLKQTVFVSCYEDAVLVIIGMDYYRYMEYLLKKNSLAELDVFGDAMSEKNRVRILAFIRQRKVVTIKEIEEELDLTATNSYYHLALMIKVGMLKTKNRGRTILYSINNDYFSSVIEAIKGYMVQEEE